MSSLTNKSWREREAACSALEAFMPQRSWLTMRPLVEGLWNRGMNVLDDVRDSTRVAAIGFMKVLSEHIIRMCNVDEVSIDIVDDTIDLILPVLLEKGLLAPSAEARGFSLGVLVKVVQAAKTALKKWLPQLVSVLIESMSALEPRTFQYMQFHTARLQISDEELEKMRIKMSQSSPMQEALDFCLQSLTVETIPEVVKSLCLQMRSGVGLATRVAAVESMTCLAEKYRAEELGVHCKMAFDCVVQSLLQAPHMAASLKKVLVNGLGVLAKVLKFK
jgi:proteasome component ECM29